MWKKCKLAVKVVQAMLLSGCLTLLAAPRVGAAEKPEMTVLKNYDTMEKLLHLVVDILLYGLGAAATLGVVIAGVLYLTARDNPAQVATAKRRLIEIAIGLAAWAMLFALLKFLIPGFQDSWSQTS